MCVCVYFKKKKGKILLYFFLSRNSSSNEKPGNCLPAKATAPVHGIANFYLVMWVFFICLFVASPSRISLILCRADCACQVQEKVVDALSGASSLSLLIQSSALPGLSCSHGNRAASMLRACTLVR